MSDPAQLLDKVIAERYRVASAIATGTIGAVYEAEDLRRGNRVALKVLQPETANQPEIAARFEREAKTMTLLEHPNIVRLLDHGRLDDGKCFLVFELVRGISVRELLDSGIVEPKRALAIVRQVLEALQHSHDHGVVHRDVKPENIMLVDGGAPDRDADLVKVLDFGVAKLVDDTLAVLGEQKLTQAGCNVFGAPLYLAPEIALGRPADHRADLYSAGVVLFELLAGRPPFTAAEPLALLELHASAKAPTLADAAPDRTFTPALEYLVAEALAKEPGNRFATGHEMIGALDRVASTLDPVASQVLPPVANATVLGVAPLPPRPSPHAPRLTAALRISWQQRRRAAIAVAVLLVVIVVITATRNGRGDRRGGASRGDLAQRALDVLARGDAAGASDMLERETATGPGRSDASAFVALGRARIALNRRSDAIAAYERAVALDSGVAHDPQVKLDALKMLDTRDTIAAVLALDFLATRVDPPSRDALVAVASNGKVAEVRHRAMAIAERDGFAGGVDHIESWSLDLEQGTTCADRRTALTKLTASGDRRVIGVLRRVRGKYECIDRDIDTAIAQLEAKP